MNAFVVVDNVTPRLPGIFAFVVQLLAEAEGHAAPALKVIVTGRAGIHASAIKVEVAARHAFLWVVGLRAVPQAFAVTALAIGGAALRLAGSWTDCEKIKSNRILQDSPAKHDHKSLTSNHTLSYLAWRPSFQRGTHQAQKSASSPLSNCKLQILIIFLKCVAIHSSLMLIFKNRTSSFPVFSAQHWEAPRSALVMPTLLLKPRGEEIHAVPAFQAGTGSFLV